MDLRVQAHADTFSQVLVVSSRAAASNRDLAELQFDTNVSGGHLRTSATGGVEVTDAAGTVVLAGAQPTLWDSSSQQAPEAPADSADPSQNLTAPQTGDQVAAMATHVTDGILTVVPDQDLLTDADTTFPVLIDPAISATRLKWTMVNKQYPTTSYYKWSSADEGMGYNDYTGTTHVKRLLWTFDTTAIQGKQILPSQFKAYETFSYSCTASRVDFYVTNNYDPATGWNTQPSLVQYVSNPTVAVGGCTPGGAWIEFDAKAAAVRAADNNYAHTNVGVVGAAAMGSAGRPRIQRVRLCDDVPDIPPVRASRANPA